MGGHGAGIPSGTGTLGGNQRLGIPALETADGRPAGLRIDSAAAWPIGTMLACMWNPDLIEEVGVAVSRIRIEAEDFNEVTGTPQAESCSDTGGDTTNA
jgi:hypothetical protein